MNPRNILVGAFCTFFGSHVSNRKKMSSAAKNGWRAFWDWFVLFSGISTASNLSRTRRDPVRRRGLFLFRSGTGRLGNPK